MSTPKPPPNAFILLYFAAAQSYTKRQHDFLSAPLAITELFSTLDDKYPGMKAKVLESCAVTVNLDYVDMEEDASVVIKEGDEVAIIPPVSSGDHGDQKSAHLFKAAISPKCNAQIRLITICEAGAPDTKQ